MAQADHMVLVVEDDPDTRAALVELLEAEGYRVITARDGIDALSMLMMPECPAPSVILTDLRMPRMSGAEFCQACADSPLLQGIPRIVATASTDTGGCKATAFVSKPLDPSFLIAAIERLVATATVR